MKTISMSIVFAILAWVGWLNLAHAQTAEVAAILGTGNCGYGVGCPTPDQADAAAKNNPGGLRCNDPDTIAIIHQYGGKCPGDEGYPE
jgi:hypothetical protein